MTKRLPAVWLNLSLALVLGLVWGANLRFTPVHAQNSQPEAPPAGLNLDLKDGMLHLSYPGDRPLSITLAQTGQLFLLSLPPGLPLACRAIFCDTPPQIRIPAGIVPAGQVRLKMGQSTLTAALPLPGRSLTLNYRRGALSIAGSGNVQPVSGTVRGNLTVAAAQNITLHAARLHATGNLRLLAGNTLTIRDSKTRPVAVQAGGRLALQGNHTVDIFALNHPKSSLASGHDLVIRSRRPIRGDAHFLSGGQVKLEQLNGQPAHLNSPYDPVVLAAGDVLLGNYTGASLHILAGGSVSLNNITITASDAAANTINPANAALFNGVDTLGSLSAFNLSNNAGITVNGNTAATLDVRAGIDWSTFAGGAPANSVIPAGAVSPTFGGATSADITVSGVISITQAAGMVLLTNQYRPNNLPGGITAGNINTFTTASNSNGGSITIDSRGNLATGLLSAYADPTGTGVTAGNGGNITLLAPAGNINTGNLDAYTRISTPNGNAAGNGGAVEVAAAGGITLNGGNGVLNTFTSVFSATGSVGNGGPVILTTTGGDINLKTINTYAFRISGAGGNAGNGGNVTLNTGNGGVTVSGDIFNSLQTFTTADNLAGNAGTIAITATQGITVDKQIRASVFGQNGNGGAIRMTTTNGNITTGNILATAADNDVLPGNGGQITLQALNGAITTGDVDAFSQGLFIHVPSQDGGRVTLRAGNGNVETGRILAYTQARGALGNAGNGGQIDITAANGSITGNGDMQAYTWSLLNNLNSGNSGNGGTITLTATTNISLTGQLDTSALAEPYFNDPTGATGSGGNISLTATNGSIAISGDVNSYAKAKVTANNGGNVILSAGGGINLGNGAGNIQAYTTAEDGNIGNGGAVTLNTTAGDIILKTANTHAFNPFGGGSAGNGGNLTLTTGNGGITVTGNLFSALRASVTADITAGNAGNITVNATRGITIPRPIDARTIGANGNGGNITLTTTGGNITGDIINATAVDNSSSPGSGGNITVQALNGGLVISDVLAYSHAIFIHNPTRNGGNITLHALNGNAVFDDLLAYSEARGEFGHTGNGGRIEVLAPNGNITGTGNLIRTDSFGATNNNKSGIVGNGSDIIMQAAGNITLNAGLQSAARSSDFFGTPSPTGSAGNAGNINLTGDNITLAYIDARSVATGTIGAGGQIQITAAQFFRGTGTLFNNPTTIAAQGLANTGAITITHGGNGITPFTVGNAATNGVAGGLATAATAINPVNAYLFDHFEPPNIWILSVPDLDMAKTANPNTNVTYHGEITYTVVLTNSGITSAAGVMVNDTLPPEVAFNRWVAQPAGADITNNQLTWNGTVPGGQTLTFAFVAGHTGNSGDVFTNTAQFFQPGTGNSGQASAVVAIAPPNQAPVVGRSTGLYNGSLNIGSGLPADQEFVYLNLDGLAVQSFAGGVTTLNTTAANAVQAGYFHNPPFFAGPVLNRLEGYTLRFTVQVVSESHATNHRAGFSVILLSSDLQGIELGFWADEIWAQEGGAAPGLFTRAEGAAFNTTAGLIPYELTVLGDSYALSTGNTPILSGKLRDYTAFAGFPDPYETPNFIFLGDDTTSAQAEIRLARVSVITNNAAANRVTATNTNLVIDDLGVMDVDALGNNVSLTLTVGNGTLFANPAATNGLSPADITGNGSGTVILTGSPGRINATLAFTPALVYRSNPGFVGTDILTATLNDNGYTGGPVLTDEKNVNITVVGPILGISKTATPNTNVTYHGEVTYTLVLTNAGSVEAANTLLTDTLPGQVNFARWVEQPSGAVENTGRITWAGTVPARGAVTFTLVVNHAGSYGESITNTATFSHPAGGSSGSSSAAFTVEPNPGAAPPTGPIYLPLINVSAAPVVDLAVNSLLVSGNAITVVVKNEGNVTITDAFWVDAYINPDPPPTGVNQLWQDLGSQGIAWGVTGSLPAQATLTLTATLTGGGPYFRAEHSNFSQPLAPGTPVYAQVDSVNFSTTYGNVQEANESNNIAGPQLATAGLSAGRAEPPSGGIIPAAANGLPRRE